ncbi:bifunctional cytochrome P450/NADPH--P450 reductase [Paenibacillus ottowii]|uniref:Bifunctional cytochrome P450/NADPH--P450 reductase n=1 Tax=Paenibacillus ottowii TaxID=2315729 RepID=A0ABY3B7B5_9BACL|nr:cytochrome P450 [Paenibacillus ottowii]TQR97385.1 cytochrome P450 [Paenibacillus ottowii]
MTSTPLIPQPKTYGPLGNLPLIDTHAPVQSLVKLANEYGPIFRMDLPEGTNIYISGHKLVADACDESRFDKQVWAPLQKVRAFAGDGLFTSWTEEPNWRKAHQILLPSFSQRAMKGYHNMMLDLAVQLVQKWSRLNPDESVEVPEDMTRLTLDTIGLCGFNYRFNSFYRDQPHPFVTSMTRALDEAMSQLQRLNLQNKLMLSKKKQFKHDIETMFSLVDSIIQERKTTGNQGEEDLLARMLEGKDPETGETLDDENIRYQIITFLIAGHETTSGLLSFAIYYLLKNPRTLTKAYEEVDRVLTDSLPSYTQVRELKYIRMILNEALRLWPTAPAFSLYAKEDTLLDGTYPLKKGDSVNVLIPKLHRDTEAWGDDVEEFRPERFEDPSAIPQDAYKPFGNGQRACIGQQFALQEATLVLGMVLKHFELIDHTHYELKVKETLTLKPEGFTIQVRPRSPQTTVMLPGAAQELHEKEEQKVAAPHAKKHGTPLLSLYGSNLGTAEGLAGELADSGRNWGFNSSIATLNDCVENLSKEGVVLITTASYNGHPPDNADAFVKWLEQAGEGHLAGVRYAVFGCGDRNWASTYQRIPRKIDELMAAKGAKRLYDRGEGDASGDFEKDWEAWNHGLWPELLNAFGIEHSDTEPQDTNSLSIEFVSGVLSAPLAANYEAATAIVTVNRELLAAESERSTRHLEIKLPTELSYREGDHLGVLPRNPASLVNRVMQRFHLQDQDYIVLRGSDRDAAHLPLDRPVSVEDLLTLSVELQEPATRAQLRQLASFTVCPPHKKEIEALLEDTTFDQEIRQKRVTMLNILEKYPACELPFENFISLLPPLKPRYYSISSSPLESEHSASITVGVVRGPARSGQGEYLGIASNYLAQLQPDDPIVIFVRKPQSGFRLPEDPSVPVIMVGPGTGVAPFRGFLQTRHALKERGEQLGEAHLYFGCRNPKLDYLYKQELQAWEQEGIVTLHTAFSRLHDQPKRYVQHVMKEDADTLIHLLDKGAHLYVCGDGSRMAPDVENTLCAAYAEAHHTSKEEAQQWLDRLQQEQRYAKDVWTGI